MVTNWNPQADWRVTALAVGGNTVYAAGDFRVIGGQARHYLAALDATSGRVLEWNPAPWRTPNEYFDPPVVSAIVPDGHAVYLGGSFEAMGGLVRNGLAAVDAKTGTVLDWNPQATDPYLPFVVINTVVAHDRTIYVGGRFTHIGGREQLGLAALDAWTGMATSWDPRPNEPIASLAFDGRQVYVGGGFTSIGREWQPRNMLAAFDATTGALLDWNPRQGADIWVIYALTALDSSVYVGGLFGSVGGQPRSNIAALDATSGAATAWNPGAGGAVWALATAGDTLYAGGIFGSLGGQSRPYAGAVDVTTGIPTAWNPSANDAVTSLAVSGNTVYAGGWFTRIGGRLLNYLAALDATTGAATGWNPSPNGELEAVAVSGSTVYAGGWFTAVGGQPRSYLAGIDTATAAPTPWSAGPDNVVYAVAASGSTVYAGGFFGTAGGVSRNYLAAFDGITGALTDWNPNPNGIIWSLATGDHTLYVGGAFGTMGYDPAVNLTVFALDTPLVQLARAPTRTGAGLWASIAPQPVRSDGLIRFSLPEPAPVSLTVYDVQGRRVASLLDHAMELAGEHEITLRTEGWREGFYFCRLTAGGTALTRKVLVLR